MRRSSFFRRNQYKIAAVCAAAAILGLAAAYVFMETDSGTNQQQIAVKEPQKTAAENAGAEEGIDMALQKKEAQQEKEKTKKASVVIAPNRDDVIRKVTIDTAEKEVEEKEEAAPETVETANMQAAASEELHFDPSKGMRWPVEGAVILDYSMDKTVYFATLNQYKYNPAVIISGNVNDQVRAAADGKITDISTNEVTGCTVTMDLGNGYTAVYGQLKEVPYEAGAYLEAGNSIGFVSEPTKYYSLEGSNLYFAMEKDGAPIDPVEYFK